MRHEKEKLEEQMEFARYEHETQELEQQLRQRQQEREQAMRDQEMRFQQREEQRKREQEHFLRQEEEMRSTMRSFKRNQPYDDGSNGHGGPGGMMGREEEGNNPEFFQQNNWRDVKGGPPDPKAFMERFQGGSHGHPDEQIDREAIWAGGRPSNQEEEFGNKRRRWQ